MKNEIRNLVFDLSEGREIFDAESNRVVDVKEANEVLRKFMFEELGLNEKATHRDIKRAFETEAGREFFQVVEEIIDRVINTGWAQSEFFNQFVDVRNMADGDRNDFYAEKPMILTVSKVSGDHHDISVQRLNEGETYTVPTSVFAVKVGSNIREFLTGRKDWGKFIAAVAEAFLQEVQNEMYTEFMNAADKMPAQYKKTGALGPATKDNLDALIEDVSMVNYNVPVVLMGTKTALKKLNGLYESGAGLNWIADSLKESVAHTGLLGDYEGTVLMEIPQRFEKNNTAQKLVDNAKILVMPLVDYKPIKFVDYGETEITVDQVAAKMDDRQTYEVQRKMGVGSVISRYFGVWTIGQ